MKKITQSATTGGAPIYLDDFKDVFNDEIWDAMQALLAPFDSDTEGIILSGCVVSGAGPYDISAGIVYLDGEFRRFAAQTGVSLPQYIKAATDVNTTRTFEDTTIKTLYVTKSADIDSSAPGSGQYIAITTSTDPNDRRWKRPVLLDGPNKTLHKKVIEIGDWNMNSDSSIGVNHGLQNYKKIRSISVIIRDDTDTDYNDLCQFRPGVYSAPDGSTTGVTSTLIALSRTSGQTFAAAAYSTTSFNRGWVTISYEG